jgi:xanthine dehydrogenase YagR molybdenum-binding subunit
MHRPGMLVAKLVVSPHAHARVKTVDASEAEKLAGVRAVRVVSPPGTEVQWEGTEIAAVAADTEEIARDAARRVRVDYEVLPHLVKEEDLNKAKGMTKPSAEQTSGNPDQAFAAAEAVHEGYYGAPTITHCCQEPHGQVVEWEGDQCTFYATTQAVSRIGGDLAKALGVKPSQVRVICEHMGGGFGSKFSHERWGEVCAHLAKQTGKPVKLMLDRDQELLMAGARPSDYARIKIGAQRDGTVTAWESESWSTGGPAGGGMPPIPYVFTIPNQRKRHVSVSTHTGPARAWRAPNHPQACLLTMCAMEDLAAKLNLDPLEVFLKNVALTARAEVYRTELLKAAELMDWKAKWHPRTRLTEGPIKRGLGLSLHTWGGRGHDSDGRLLIHPDGSVQVQLASQDLGTGTRTVIGIVAAETLGLPIGGVQVQIGDTIYPPSGASGGSTTVGGVSSSTRRAAIKALDKLFEAVAPGLGATPDKLVAVDGRIHVAGDPAKGLTWKAACAKLPKPISELGRNPARDEGNLIDSGVGGVQMAEVEVDTETGIVRVKKMVAVQDCGLIINLKAAESQCYGAISMAMSAALFEERIFDEQSGRMLNADMEFTKLTGNAEAGEIVVHLMTGLYDGRGVIGLGEPPVVSPMAAISNAVANAIGVRVATMPMTPDKVLAALANGRRT